jgi:hypothetical protein
MFCEMNYNLKNMPKDLTIALYWIYSIWIPKDLDIMMADKINDQTILVLQSY